MKRTHRAYNYGCVRYSDDCADVLSGAAAMKFRMRRAISRTSHTPLVVWFCAAPNLPSYETENGIATTTNSERTILRYLFYSELNHQRASALRVWYCTRCCKVSTWQSWQVSKLHRCGVGNGRKICADGGTPGLCSCVAASFNRPARVSRSL